MAMARIYIRKIRDGKITIDDVKPMWKEQVIALLNELETAEEKH